MAIQDKFNRANVIYKITKDIDLGGETLTIPEGCTLDFQGGSFSNGVIVYSNTLLKNNVLLYNCNVKGSVANAIVQDFYYGQKEDLTDLIPSIIQYNAKHIILNKDYILSDCLIIEQDDITISSCSNVTISSKNELSGIVVSGNNCLVKNITLVGAGNTTKGTEDWVRSYNAGIVLFRNKNSKVEHCTIKNYFQGIYLTCCQNCSIVYNKCTNCLDGIGLDDYGYNFGASENIYPCIANKIKNNTCSYNNRTGILCECSASQSNDVREYLTGVVGDYIQSINNIIDSNICNNNNKHNGDWGVGIDLDYSNYYIVTNNLCFNNESVGILIYHRSEDNIITNNICRNNKEGGISVSTNDLTNPPKRNTLSNNNCSLNGQFGISINGGTDCTITNNICHHNNENGIIIKRHSCFNVVANNIKYNNVNLSMDSVRTGHITTNLFRKGAYGIVVEDTYYYSQYLSITNNKYLDTENNIDIHNFSGINNIFVREPEVSNVSSSQSTFVDFSDSENVYNVDKQKPNLNFFYSLDNILSVVPNRYKKSGQIISFLTSEKSICQIRFKSRDINNWNDLNFWEYLDGTPANASKKGNTSNRPSEINIGFQYYDSTLNKPIWWTGSAWVDATGAEV